MASNYLNNLTADQRARAAKVKLLALDVDGTLSDGRLWFTSDGKEIKAFHVLDGQGMKLLREHNIEVALITARESPVVQTRARELGLRHVYQGSRNKLDSLDHLCNALSVMRDQVAYMGDDLPDLPVLKVVGFAAAPANAHPWVRDYAHWHSQSGGGEGAVRELCDAVLLAKGLMEAILQRYLPE